VQGVQYARDRGKRELLTPVIGMLGLIEDLGDITTAAFKEAGDLIIELGNNNGHIGGSVYLATIHGLTRGDAPPIDLAAESNLQQCLLGLIRKRLVRSAHDCSEGGLAVALAECCIIDDEHEALGARVSPDYGDLRKDRFLFGEDQSRVILSAHPRHVEEVLAHASRLGVPASVIGTVGGQTLDFTGEFAVAVGDLRESYNSALSRILAE